jgi:tRNA modification GTPase
MAALVPDRDRSGDVIVAPATPPGVSALAIVRLSGPPGAAVAVARAVAPALRGNPEPRRAVFGRFVDADGRPLDEGIVLPFPAPGSATGEEVVELFCHGSPAIVAALLEAARRAGARPATPGEFTRRALANGKVDLAAAEGIALLAGAASRSAARRALGLVAGDLSRRVAALRETLLSLLAGLEASLDFAEDAGEPERPALAAALAREAAALEALVLAARATAGRDRIPAVVIAGRPNAGKSTLFNALFGSDRAIVTARPGTTRDAIAETVEFGDLRVRLVDTAGLRESEDEPERLGVEAARRAIGEADVVLLVLDGAEGGTAADVSAREALGGRALVVRTKTDLAASVGGLPADVAVSARTGEGVEALKALLIQRLSLAEPGEGLLVLDRHRDALERTAAAVRAAAAAPADELVAAALRDALHSLGEITGETATAELLDRIFSTFCIGK